MGDFANKKWDLTEWYGNAGLAKKSIELGSHHERERRAY